MEICQRVTRTSSICKTWRPGHETISSTAQLNGGSRFALFIAASAKVSPLATRCHDTGYDSETSLSYRTVSAGHQVSDRDSEYL